LCVVGFTRLLDYGPWSHKVTVCLQISPLWPENGSISFCSVCLRYRCNLPYALNDVSFEIRPGEKIGIVGRTGAGKSSLFVALLRLVEIEMGSIIVDGVNIQHISLTRLRYVAFRSSHNDSGQVVGLQQQLTS